jgi:hypothetical protein
MFITITGILRSLLSFNTKEREEEIARLHKIDHSYQRLNMADRAPCPGLNALANQGYL